MKRRNRGPGWRDIPYALTRIAGVWLPKSTMPINRIMGHPVSYLTGSGLEQLAPEFRPVVAFSQLFRTSPRLVSEKVYISCGQFESLIHHNRELVPLLEAAGMEVRYTETRDGHNWENWRDRLHEGLSFLFPGQASQA